jgi:DNA polymerase-1
MGSGVLLRVKTLPPSHSSGITRSMATKLFEAGADDVLYVVDLSSYLLRAYHAVAPLSSPSGEPTHAVHGTVTMLERLFRDRTPRLVSIAMDSGRNTFRKELYPEYKANRPPAPDDLRVQIRRAEEIVRAWGISVVKQDGVEADDLIASLVKEAQAAKLRVVIVSADKDLMQLVSPQVIMWDTLRNKVFGEEEVVERFGVSACQLGDLLALMGDSSDNIPGVPSVGPKTAALLLQEHKDLDGIFSALESITKKKLKQTLTENEDAARLSRKLVQLKNDCDVSVRRADLAFSQPERRDEAALRAIYESLGFTRQLAALKGGTAIFQQDDDASRIPVSVERSDASNEPQEEIDSISLVTKLDDLANLVSRLNQGRWSLEVLTIRPDLHRGPIIAASLSTPKASYYLPFAHRYVGAPSQLDVKIAFGKILSAISGGDGQLAVHDLKRTLVLLRESGVTDELGAVHDVLLGSYLLDPERNHGVEALAASVDIVIEDYDKFSKEGRRKRPWDELEVEPAMNYAASRTRAILNATVQQQKKLDELGLTSLLHQTEIPLARLLAELEQRGVLVDVARLEELSKICAEQLSRLEKEAHDSAKESFNVNSPRQLETILFDKLGLKPIKRTKTSRSTDAQTLESLEEEHELPGIILKLRQISKLKSTYIDALPAMVRPETGRIHGAWEQAVAATGRLSSTDPNLQNIPIRSELGRQIREAFIAPPGHKIVSADYSQIELRVLAHLSRDQRLVEAFQTGQDVHARTAMELFEVDEVGVTREMRARAKAVNFGVIYGQGEGALSKSLGIERKEAARFIATYFRRYDGVRTFMDETLENARKGQAVHSLLGRRRVVPDIKSGHRGRRLAAERIAMNMPIQGSAADILKLAMLRLTLPVTKGTRMILTVHDELVFEVPDDEVEEAQKKITREMEAAYELCVPLTVEVGHGKSWNDAH